MNCLLVAFFDQISWQEIGIFYYYEIEISPQMNTKAATLYTVGLKTH